jgi:hypothetical protein
MAWALTMELTILVVYASFPVKGDHYLVKEEDMYIISVSFFLDLTLVLNCVPLKTNLGTFSVCLPDHLLFQSPHITEYERGLPGMAAPKVHVTF